MWTALPQISVGVKFSILAPLCTVFLFLEWDCCTVALLSQIPLLRPYLRYLRGAHSGSFPRMVFCISSLPGFYAFRVRSWTITFKYNITLLKGKCNKGISLQTIMRVFLLISKSVFRVTLLLTDNPKAPLWTNIPGVCGHLPHVPYSSSEQMFMKHLLFIWYCASWWSYLGEQNRYYIPGGSYNLAKKQALN